MVSQPSWKEFLATSLPMEEAGKRCRRIWDCLDGGVFSSGSCVILKEKREKWQKRGRFPASGRHRSLFEALGCL